MGDHRGYRDRNIEHFHRLRLVITCIFIFMVRLVNIVILVPRLVGVKEVANEGHGGEDFLCRSYIQSHMLRSPLSVGLIMVGFALFGHLRGE